jgi:hypothetical protein
MVHNFAKSYRWKLKAGLLEGERGRAKTLNDPKRSHSPLDISKLK